MNAATYDFFEDTNAGQLITALVMAPVSMLIALFWCLEQVAKLIIAFVRVAWRDVLIATSGVAMAALFVALPQLLIGLALVVAYGWAMKPGKGK